MEFIFSIVMSFHMCSVVNDFLGIFQKIFRAAFSKNTAVGMLLIS